MALDPGALIAGIDPAVTFLRTDWPLKFQRLATWGTVKNSVIRFSASVNQVAASWAITTGRDGA